MNLLVLGGPRFLGRHVIAAALAAGHQVTLFNRGRTEPERFPEARKIRGDRAGDLAALREGSWDAVIDTSGYLPQVVRHGAEMLRDRVGHYVIVSSISVYADFSRPGMDENAPVATLTPEQAMEVEAIDASEPLRSPRFLELYGPLKTACERVVQETFPGRASIVRPGLIAGPHDYMDRFPYWVSRVADGGEVLAPGRPDRPVQIVDARDLASWMLRLAERRTGGVFNATGPESPIPMSRMLETCREASASDARFVWVDESFLVDHRVTPWQEMPMWVPETTSDDHAGILQMDVRRAIESGLRFRPLVETARDVLAWERARGPHAWRAGLDREKERALLEEWRMMTRSRS